MSLERCTECERIVDTDMEEGKYIKSASFRPEKRDLEVLMEFYCDTCTEKLELDDE